MSMVGAGAVVVGVDGSKAALHAVRWAAVEAHSLRCPLRLVHATMWPMITRPVPPATPRHYEQVLSDAANDRLRQAREVAEHVAPGVQADERRLIGDAATALIAQCTDAREVVVGSRGLGGFTGMLVGSVAAALTHHASCPVVVVRYGGDPNGPVVVGVDGSPAGEGAVAYAFDAACRARAPVLAVHTWSDVGVAEWWTPLRSMLDWEAIADDERRVLAERLAGWQEKYPDVTVRRVVEQDRPAHRLRELGRRARLLVVGSRGRGGFTGMLLGSTSRTLVHHAACPLVVVRTGTRPVGGQHD